jgi:transcription antitermination factor NusA-like protein
MLVDTTITTVATAVLTVHYSVDDSFMGLIIGKAGANIKAVQNSTGCEIKMLEGGNITISGML